jgi:hypothetical protein
LSETPSTNGANGGRASNGRFTKGYAGGPGNPFGKRVAELRSALFDAVTVDDLREIVQTLVTLAKQGDIAAAKEVLERTLGKPTEHDLFERLEALEERLKEPE